MTQTNLFGGFNQFNQAKANRSAIAHDTVELSKQGYYMVGEQKVTIDPRLESHRVPIEKLANTQYPDGSRRPKYKLMQSTTGDAIREVRKAIPSGTIGVLNFASARQVGGGFLNGAMAQEEALCYCSNLYLSQLDQPDYYTKNTAFKSGLYTNEMFMSSYVTFFKDDAYNLQTEPVVVGGVLTVPAVNRTYLTTAAAKEADKVMLDRIRLIIKAFIHEELTTIILGAFGCGVFGNDPIMVAECFKEVLMQENLDDYFDEIIFAIPNRADGNFKAFKSVLF